MGLVALSWLQLQFSTTLVTWQQVLYLIAVSALFKLGFLCLLTVSIRARCVHEALSSILSE